MPKIALRESDRMETRNSYTTVTYELAIALEGKELPNTETLGKALDMASATFKAAIKESYKVVPERVG